jgi:hypothetical protein
MDLAFHAPSTTIWGADTGDYFNDLPGLATGDLNGDGLQDVLIAARFGDGPENSREDSGELYVIFGSNDLPPTIDLAAGEEGLTIYGAEAGDQLGFHAAAADVNGDGIDDMLLASPFIKRSDSQAVAGAVHVIFGRPDLEGVIDLAQVTPDVTLIGPGGSSFFGDAVAATDANGDDILDILIGATFTRRPPDLPDPGQQAGAAFLVFGSADLGGVLDMAEREYDLAVYGAEVFQGSDEAGDFVAGGDVNGDGIGDILIGAEAADGPTNDRTIAAEVYVVYGSTDIGGVLDIAAGDQDVIVFGAEQNDTLGFNIAAGDVDGDGVDELLMTARLADGPDNRIQQAGEVHILLGGNIPASLDLATDDSDAHLYGDDSSDLIGRAIGTVDLDGDGVQELFIGSRAGDGPEDARQDGGEAYFLDARGLRGAVSVLDAPAALLVYGAEADDGLGAAIATGDVDGDGDPELVILASRADGPDNDRPEAGEIYILNP